VTLRADALSIWHAAVDAVRPEPLVIAAVEKLRPLLEAAPTIRVVGCGKAGAAMAVGVETALANILDRVVGWVNVPEGFTATTKRIRLHPARLISSNAPTPAGIDGARAMVKLLADAGPDDIALGLISGGGSALLPWPVEGVSLDDKIAVTALLAGSGATIGEMNAVRKHLSRVKGGRLAEGFRGKRFVTLIISDVVGDPLDVIASGPTTPDPTTYADALAVLDRRGLLSRTPASVLNHLERGRRGELPETPKSLPATVGNRLIGTNALALAAATRTAERLGYRVVSLGSAVEGETADVARRHAAIVRTLPPKTCLLSGGETTVTLGRHPGKGGRNQEYALALALALGDMPNTLTLSGGTDGEDGPTDAAGAIADADTLRRAAALGLSAADHLARHDAYPFFDAVGDLRRTGLTGTNVVDVRLTLVG
jgi:hydroxypyruvate reductase/glycerate 2-kinase